jgi:fatty acid desaturase
VAAVSETRRRRATPSWFVRENGFASFIPENWIETEQTSAFNGVMSNITTGLIAGLIFGAVSVGMMLPMSFPDKRAALLAAFLNRFAIGLVIGCVTLPGWPGWLVGLLFGLLLSLPAALVTKAYAPILIIGAIGGVVIGGIIHGWR